MHRGPRAGLDGLRVPLGMCSSLWMCDKCTVRSACAPQGAARGGAAPRLLAPAALGARRARPALGRPHARHRDAKFGYRVQGVYLNPSSAGLAQRASQPPPAAPSNSAGQRPNGTPARRRAKGNPAKKKHRGDEKCVLPGSGDRTHVQLGFSYKKIHL